ncbi:hypothetical protein IPJ91_03215 [bacterium]|nr:MAG: hypothetical protein IPJ91_03215 [bacterium]
MLHLNKRKLSLVLLIIFLILLVASFLVISNILRKQNIAPDRPSAFSGRAVEIPTPASNITCGVKIESVSDNCNSGCSFYGDPQSGGIYSKEDAYRCGTRNNSNDSLTQTLSLRNTTGYTIDVRYGKLPQ